MKSGNELVKAAQANVSRRRLLKAGMAGIGALAAGCAVQASAPVNTQQQSGVIEVLPQATRALHYLEGKPADHASGHRSTSGIGHKSITVGEVNAERNGFDPLRMLVEFDTGKVSLLPSGQALREYTLHIEEKEIEIAPGVFFPAWTYNGRVPGPTLRCTEGDRIRVEFINGGSHPHSIHFHGVHPVEMDGVPGTPGGDIQPGGKFVYEFDAEPFGILPYHCHVTPIKRHIHKGLYGMLIVDPKEGRPPAREFAIVMNAFDTNFDNENEVYAVNSVAFEYARRPIPIKLGELVRIYLTNFVEFDLLNSFHLHANVFDYYDHGTTLEPTLRRVDDIVQVQGQRGILEFKYKHTGKPMFHAHVSEFTELGWMGHFNVVKPEDFAVALREVGMDEAWNDASLNSNTSVRA
jgi:FtsP/CotA-like multicopper oxidase with cupredoxin domain